MGIGQAGCSGRNARHPVDRGQDSDRGHALVSLDMAVRALVKKKKAVSAMLKSVHQVTAFLFLMEPHDMYPCM